MSYAVKRQNALTPKMRFLQNWRLYGTGEGYECNYRGGLRLPCHYTEA